MDPSKDADTSSAKRSSYQAFSEEDVPRALASALRAALARGEEAAVPGLGTFRTEHHASRIERLADGTLVAHPPRRTPAFDPDDALPPTP